MKCSNCDKVFLIEGNIPYKDYSEKRNSKINARAHFIIKKYDDFYLDKIIKEKPILDIKKSIDKLDDYELMINGRMGELRLAIQDMDDRAREKGIDNSDFCLCDTCSMYPMNLAVDYINKYLGYKIDPEDLK